MEGLIQFTGIVMIAFGILQIILFFKIWGMTNNVKRIWKKIDNKDFLSDACVNYIKIKEKYTRIFKKIDKPAPDFNKYEEPKMYLL